ncbi:hypothetical protein J6590_086310 [Homalodisca vitripennis]|nr:hypothetical protein J6590_086310 [Homalodisca vitripennis]
MCTKSEDGAGVQLVEHVAVVIVITIPLVSKSLSTFVNTDSVWLTILCILCRLQYTRFGLLGGYMVEDTNTLEVCQIYGYRLLRFRYTRGRAMLIKKVINTSHLQTPPNSQEITAQYTFKLKTLSTDYYSLL